MQLTHIRYAVVAGTHCPDAMYRRSRMPAPIPLTAVVSVTDEKEVVSKKFTRRASHPKVRRLFGQSCVYMLCRLDAREYPSSCAKGVTSFARTHGFTAEDCPNDRAFRRTT